MKTQRIDLNINSKYFGQIYYSEISASEKISLYIPDHYGHGYLTLEETTFLYNCYGSYSSKEEISINLIDLIKNKTKLKIKTDELIISKKDESAPKLKDIDFKKII